MEQLKTFYQTGLPVSSCSGHSMPPTTFYMLLQSYAPRSQIYYIFSLCFHVGDRRTRLVSGSVTDVTPWHLNHCIWTLPWRLLLFVYVDGNAGISARAFPLPMDHIPLVFDRIWLYLLLSLRGRRWPPSSGGVVYDHDVTYLWIRCRCCILKRNFVDRCFAPLPWSPVTSLLWRIPPVMQRRRAQTFLWNACAAQTDPAVIWLISLPFRGAIFPASGRFQADCVPWLDGSLPYHGCGFTNHHPKTIALRPFFEIVSFILPHAQLMVVEPFYTDGCDSHLIWVYLGNLHWSKLTPYYGWMLFGWLVVLGLFNTGVMVIFINKNFYVSFWNLGNISFIRSFRFRVTVKACMMHLAYSSLEAVRSIGETLCWTPPVFPYMQLHIIDTANLLAWWHFFHLCGMDSVSQIPQSGKYQETDNILDLTFNRTGPMPYTKRNPPMSLPTFPCGCHFLLFLANILCISLSSDLRHHFNLFGSSYISILCCGWWEGMLILASLPAFLLISNYACRVPTNTFTYMKREAPIVLNVLLDVWILGHTLEDRYYLRGPFLKPVCTCVWLFTFCMALLT